PFLYWAGPHSQSVTSEQIPMKNVDPAPASCEGAPHPHCPAGVRNTDSPAAQVTTPHCLLTDASEVLGLIAARHCAPRIPRPALLSAGSQTVGSQPMPWAM